jgi:putative sterol carrier protein
MTVTVQDLIMLLPKAFLPEKTVGIDADIFLNLKGKGGGEWTASIHDQKCTVQEGVPPNPKMTLTAEAQDLVDIFTGKLDGMKAFMTGKLKVNGDMSLALKMTSYFAVTPELLNSLDR